ncbi:MAG: thioredoxin family protein [Candidatus Omnitrophica bacterium]|nr:thioredoxin family protein [Candidatus Omnitrophota bacterium]
MNIRVRALFWVIVLMSAVVFPRQTAALTVGEQAPDFTAVDINGQEQSWSAYKGKYVVLEWFNFDCPFVKKHYESGNMQRLQKKYTEQGIIWISICSSAAGKQGYYNPQELSRLAQEKGANATAVIQDADGAIGRLYGAKTTPHMFIIAPLGRLVYDGAIDSIPGTDQEEIAGAINYVQEALNALLQGRSVAVGLTKSYGCSVKY